MGFKKKRGAPADSFFVSAAAIRIFFALSELLVNKKRMCD